MLPSWEIGPDGHLLINLPVDRRGLVHERDVEQLTKLAETIRADFATSIEENVVHGSDGPETARQEIGFFFSDDQICPRTR